MNVHSHRRKTMSRQADDSHHREQPRASAVTRPLHLAKRGHRVIATGRNEKALAELKCEAAGARARDAAARRHRRRVDCARARARSTRSPAAAALDVLVNNAGFGVLGPTELITDADMRAQYETNVFGLMAVTRAFLPDDARARRRPHHQRVEHRRARTRCRSSASTTRRSTRSSRCRTRCASSSRRSASTSSLIEPGVIATDFTDRSMRRAERIAAPTSPVRAGVRARRATCAR